MLAGPVAGWRCTTPARGEETPRKSPTPRAWHDPRARGGDVHDALQKTRRPTRRWIRGLRPELGPARGPADVDAPDHDSTDDHHHPERRHRQPEETVTAPSTVVRVVPGDDITRAPDPPPTEVSEVHTLPFTVTETDAGEQSYRFTLASADTVNVTLTGMDRDIDCRVNLLNCTNYSGMTDDSWSGTLEAGTYTVTVYPYNADSRSWTLSVSRENPPSQTPPGPGAATPEPRYFKLSLPWESDVEVHLTDMTIDFDCKVNDSPCTNRGSTRDDSWTGTLAAGDHVIEVYPYRPGSGSYTLSVKVSPTLTSSYYGSVTKTETVVDVSEKDVSSSRSYPFTLEHGAEVSVALTGLTIDFDCKVDDSRCTTAAAPRTIRGAARWPPATTRSRPTPTIRAPGTTRSP